MGNDAKIPDLFHGGKNTILTDSIGSLNLLIQKKNVGVDPSIRQCVTFVIHHLILRFSPLAIRHACFTE
jgi:hypothetical protein